MVLRVLYRFLLLPVFMASTISLSAQVEITGNQNNIAVEEVRLRVAGTLHVQTTDVSTRTNPSPTTDPVIIETILLADGTEIFATTRTPSVGNLHPDLGTTSIPIDGVGVAKYDGNTVSHRSVGFEQALEEVVSTPDLRSYWDIGGGSIPSGERFMDVMYPQEVPKSGYLVVSERDGNSKFNFQALDVNGDPIPGAETLQLRGYEWNTQVVNQGNYPGQPQHLVVISPTLFDTDLPIYGFSVINLDGADGKIVFFRNSIHVNPDLPEPVFSGDTAIINVLHNDELKEQAATVANVSVYTLTGVPDEYVVLRSDGFVDVAPEAPAGTYTIVYNICEIGNSTNCDSGTVTVEVMYALPVVWLDYTAVAGTGGNMVIWNTASEKDNKKYRIWRTSDPLQGFKLVGELPAKEASTEPLHYTFLDTVDFSGDALYYRIDQVDVDGKISTTSVFKLKLSIRKTPDFQVYPNPHFAGQVVINIPPGWKGKMGTIGIQSYLGTVHYLGQGEIKTLAGSVSSRLQELPKGMYILNVQVENERKVIKWIKR